jgi:capsular exopolysaccharide synthesis family protein
MSLSSYFKPLLKWWWLLLLASVVAVVSSYLVTRRQPPVYQTRTTMIIGRAVYESNPTGNEFNLNQQLAKFYADLAQREPVRIATQEELGINRLPAYTSQVRPDSSIIEILVTDTDPVRAQAVANTLAEQLVRQTPGNNPDEQERQDFINEQLNELERRIKETSTEISDSQTELANLLSAREIESKRAEITSLEQSLSSLRSNYSNLLSNTNQGATNTITIIERASLPQRPIGPNKLILVFLSGVIALAIAAGAAYLLEYLDDTYRSSDDIEHSLGIPVIGMISEIDKSHESGTYVAKQPRSAIAESYRGLRTDLEFSSVDRPLKTLFITSPGVDAGKTTTCLNLATVIAQSGKKVILLDADLRKPTVHTYLGISNQKGLSEVFRGSVDVYNSTTNWKDGNFFVIPSGPQPPNPAELLSSKKMDQIVDSLERAADFVVIDGPPFLVADASILASKVDGVILVIRYGYTRRSEVQHSIRQLKRIDARILGVVLNRIPRAGSRYFGSQRYYNSGYYGDDEKEKNAAMNGKGLLAGLIKRKTKTPPEADILREGK